MLTVCVDKLAGSEPRPNRLLLDKHITEYIR